MNLSLVKRSRTGNREYNNYETYRKHFYFDVAGKKLISNVGYGDHLNYLDLQTHQIGVRKRETFILLELFYLKLLDEMDHGV